MTSPARVAANQANAQLSTGPRSQAGKQRSAANAFRHGLTARTLVVRDDERDDFDQLAKGLFEDIRPDSPLEKELFDQVLQASWTLRRTARLETDLIAGDLDPLLVDAATRRLQLLDLYRSRAERTLHRALAEIRTLQSQRLFRRVLNGTTKGFAIEGKTLIDVAKVRRELVRDHQHDPGSYARLYRFASSLEEQFTALQVRKQAAEAARQAEAPPKTVVAAA